MASQSKEPVDRGYQMILSQVEFRNKFHKKQKKKKILSGVLWTLGILVAACAMFLACFHVSISPDDSMNNTISENEIVLTNRLAYLAKLPQRGEIVTFRLQSSLGSVKTVSRRIIAFEGEQVDVRDGGLYINGNKCEENYTEGITESDISDMTVQDHTYYVLCDNRASGPDSRHHVDVVPESVIGSVVFHWKAPDAVIHSGLFRTFIRLEDMI